MTLFFTKDRLECGQNPLIFKTIRFVGASCAVLPWLLALMAHLYRFLKRKGLCTRKQTSMDFVSSRIRDGIKNLNLNGNIFILLGINIF